MAGSDVISSNSQVNYYPLNSGNASASDAEAATTATGGGATPNAGNWWDQFWGDLWGEGKSIAEGPLSLAPSGADPLSGLWSSIAAGLEGGATSFLMDLWNLILGPLWIITGIFLALVAVILLARNDIALGVRVAGALA